MKIHIARWLHKLANKLNPPKLAYDHTPRVFADDDPSSPYCGTRVNYWVGKPRWSTETLVNAFGYDPRDMDTIDSMEATGRRAAEAFLMMREEGQ